MKQTNLDNFFNFKNKNKNNIINNSMKNHNIFTSTPNNSPTNTNILNFSNNIVDNKISLNNNYYLLRFDGASKGNPGKAGSGAVLYDSIGNEVFTISRNLGIQTNNYAEYFGLLIGLQEASKRKIKYIHVEGDSQLIINQLTGKYRIKNEKLKILYLALQPIISGFTDIKFKHIYRNKNSRADELANKAINSLN